MENIRGRGGRIAQTIDGSPAAKAGLRKGDLVVSINGIPLSDSIDYLYLTSGTLLKIRLIRSGKAFEAFIKKEEEEVIGIRFECEIFDGLKVCRNKCHFCFVDQVPPSLRGTLKIKDDDFRLSFLHGNFISLTNMEEKDWERIRRYRLSPLYLSVHATRPELRVRIFRNPAAERIREHLERFRGWGIRIHTQVVLCPGINDGKELERTVMELAEFYPSVSSIAVVPVGVTRYLPKDSPIRSLSLSEMKETVMVVHSLQKGFRRRMGETLVYLGDEFYLKTSRALPRSCDYGDFPQIENGVGMMRMLMGEFRRKARFLPAAVSPARHVSIVTGELAYSHILIISEALNRVQGLKVTVHRVKNSFWGPQVDVAGLLTGGDILQALEKEDGGERVLIPSACLREDLVFLDGLTLSALGKRLGREVIPVKPSYSDLLMHITRPKGKVLPKQGGSHG
ncbi:MAG: DUF512 domain-containing protein [Candidatus Eremiobacteraeota bacterium]|nr:DUF512 domain-containing protein [Candidatus Eremiobacteraeota bacterium]